MNDQLAAPVHELLALYEEKYSDVRFPDLDLAVLKTAAAEVAEAEAKVIAAEASIAPLREQVRAAESDLAQKIARALAFLKVYVEGDEAEYARLDALTQSLVARRGPRRPTSDSGSAASGERVRRGRKPKPSAASSDGSSEVVLSSGDLSEADLPSSALTEFERVAE